MILQHIIDIIESVAPLSRQEEWDNSGLQIGSGNTHIERVLLTTDVTEQVVNEAIQNQCQLILSHHPLLYHGLKSITGQNDIERCVLSAIRHGIAIYSSHTAMDNYIHGVSGRMAQVVGLNPYRILVPQPTQPTCDIQTGKPTREPQYGLGVIGQLPHPIEFGELLRIVRTRFGADSMRFIPPVLTNQQDAMQQPVQTIALCGGAGSEFMEDAIRQGADVFISADFKYHAFQPAVGRIGVIDMDHWVSEHFTRDVFADLLKDKVETLISHADHTPVCYYYETKK
ncbi:MAG: Nif3-like dinuclear metal center hexameric protein [Paludibacteraceae bacterium]|nr:Nif3-like dinuclear metal center hexameric protein [Paludibacteraceae bacterium]